MVRKRVLSIVAAILCILLSLGASAASGKPVESITLEGPEEVYTGTSKRTTSTVLPKDASDRRLKWTSSDTDIAVVSSEGTVRGKNRGTAVITAEARDGSGVTASFTVRVIDKVTGIKLDKSSVNLLVGAEGADTAKIGYTVSPSNAYYKDVTYASSKNSVVTVDEDGTLHAVAGGTAKITLTTKDPGSKAKAVLNVTVGEPVRSIVITDPPSVINKGRSVRITAEAQPKTATDRGILYSSGNESVFTVERSGTVHARGTGTATLTCTAKDGSGVSETIEITVIQMVMGISAKSAPKAMIAGTSKQFTLQVKPEDATDPTIAWSSSDPSVAKVDENGRVTAVKKGDCTIYGKSVDGSGKEIKLPLTVEPAVPVKLSGFGQGVDSAGIIVLSFKNSCKKLAVRKISFEYSLLDAWGNPLAGGSHTASVSIPAGESATVMEAVYAPDETVRYAITLTGVTFSDGTAYSIPESKRVTDVWA